MPRLLTYFMCAAIIATVAGGIGGSFQPARLILAGSALLAVVASHANVTDRIVSGAWTMAGVMVLFGAISLFWTVDTAGGMGLVLAVAIGALSFYVVARSDLGQDGVVLMMWAWTIAVAISMPIAAYEIVTGNHFAFALEDRNVGGVLGQFPFASIFFGNFNDYSTWLCLSFPIIVANFVRLNDVKLRIVVISIIFCLVGVVFVNTSRAALVYTILVSVIYMAISKSLRFYAGCAMALLIPTFIIKYQEDIFRIYDFAVYRFQISGLQDESYIQRSGLIEAGYNSMKDTFGAGVGVGGFEEYIIDYYPDFIPNPHNILLEIAVNFGIVALGVFIAFLVRLFVVGVKRTDIPMEYRVTIVVGALSVPVIGTIPSQAIGYVYWWIWLATLVGIAACRVDGPAKSQSALDGAAIKGGIR